MRRLTLYTAALVLATTSLFGGDNFSVSIGDSDFTDCRDLSVRMDGDRVPVVSEDVPFSGNSLTVRTDRNGGIRLIGSRGGNAAVTLCKAAAPGIDLASIRTSLSGGTLTVEGPDSGRWVAYVLIEGPANGSFDLEASNGPISISDFHGTVRAQASNGPVSVKDSSGTINAETRNGPVSVSGSRGNVKLEATNGPVSVRLSDTIWDGNLEASTRNGPLSLKLPRGFRSGVVVESSGHGPVTCKAEGCPERARGWMYDDEQRGRRPERIELGSGPRVVRLSTVNGPVSIKENE
jgi:hypothetical protein